MKIYDSDIRNLLYSEFLKVKSYNDNETIVVNEMDICSGVSRADIAVINGKFHGYEIKSKQDSLERLSNQVESYNKVFNTMTIVAFETHIEKIKNIVPYWWGIKSVNEKNKKITLKTIRRCKQNRNIDINSLVMLLWREEMLNMISNHSEVIKGYKSKTRAKLSQMIINIFEEKIIIEYVKKALKTRSSWKALTIQSLYDDYSNM